MHKQNVRRICLIVVLPTAILVVGIVLSAIHFVKTGNAISILYYFACAGVTAGIVSASAALLAQKGENLFTADMRRFPDHLYNLSVAICEFMPSKEKADAFSLVRATSLLTDMDGDELKRIAQGLLNLMSDKIKLLSAETQEHDPSSHQRLEAEEIKWKLDNLYESVSVLGILSDA